METSSKPVYTPNYYNKKCLNQKIVISLRKKTFVTTKKVHKKKRKKENCHKSKF